MARNGGMKMQMDFQFPNKEVVLCAKMIEGGEE
jgi:hypothetical protein